MPTEQIPEDRGGGGVLAGLLAPLRLPERVIEALESLAEAGRHLGPMRAELTRVREQTEPLPDLMPALDRVLEHTAPVPDLLAVTERISEQAEPLAGLLPALERLEERIATRLDSLQQVVAALEGQDSYLNEALGELCGEVTAMHKTISGLQDDVQSITERLPDPTRGPLEKARHVLTGTGG